MGTIMGKSYLRSGLLFVFLFFAWEIITYEFADLKFVLPAPSKIGLRLWEGYDRFLFNMFVTFKEMLGGFCLALTVAFPLAWLMSRYHAARQILQPIFVIIQCIPMFALAPIMVIWFGWSYTAIVIPTALMIFFPLTMNIYQGLLSTPQYLLDYFRINQATAWQTFYKLQLPWAVPHICSGFKISAAIAGFGVIAGEWAGAQAGLGIMMLEGRRGADLEASFGALFCLTLMSISFYWLALSVERRVFYRRSGASVGKIASLLVCVSTTLLLSGCQSDSSPSQKRLVLDWLPNPNHVPVYVGIHNGYFTRRGIDLQIVKVHDQGSTLPYLTSGQAELALSYMPHTMRSIAKGAEVLPIAPLIREPLNALIFRKEDGIKTIADLNSRVIGYSVDGSQTKFLDAILQVNRIKPQEKRNVSFDLVSTLGTKGVDAIYGGYWNIEAEHLGSYGIETDYFKLEEFGVPNYYELLFIVKKNGSQTDPAFLKAFREALAETIAYCQQEPEKAFEDLCAG